MSQFDKLNRSQLFAEARARGLNASRNDTNDDIKFMLRNHERNKPENQATVGFRSLFRDYETQADNFDNTISSLSRS